MARGELVRRPRSLRAEFDDSFKATSRGGAVLIEQTMRKLGLRGMLERLLPARPGDSHYTSGEVGYAVIAGLLCGGRGFQSAGMLRKDPVLAGIFGLSGRVAEEATVWRALCQMAGLEERALGEAYERVSSGMARLDILGHERKQRQYRRLVPEQPEAMTPECAESFDRLLTRSAIRCCERLAVARLTAAGWHVYHGDATDLEVNGRCFDGARRNHEGQMSLRLQTVGLGPVCCAQQLMEGASDEGTNMPVLLDKAQEVFLRVCGKRRMLGLFDAAYCEWGVVKKLLELGHDYIVCANQYRAALIEDAEQPGTMWIPTGPDASRGWSQSEVAVFKRRPEGWGEAQTVVARRWRVEGELSLAWHHSFLYTNVIAEKVSKKSRKRYGYASYIWMLYSTKQGHENFYKPRLSDLGGHQPGSGRLGAAQALCALTALASNVYAVLSYRVVAPQDRGIRQWRFLRDYVEIAARTVMLAGGVLLVRLSSTVESGFRQLWDAAFACARRL